MVLTSRPQRQDQDEGHCNLYRPLITILGCIEVCVLEQGLKDVTKCGIRSRAVWVTNLARSWLINNHRQPLADNIQRIYESLSYSRLLVVVLHLFLFWLQKFHAISNDNNATTMDKKKDIRGVNR